MESNAQLTIDMKNVGIHDTLYTCDNIVSITFSPATLLEPSNWIVEKRVDDMWIETDTINHDTLSLSNVFWEGTVRHNSWDGTDWLQTSIEVRPLRLNTSYIAGDCNTELQLFASTNFSGEGNVTYNWEPSELVSDPHIANPTTVVTGNAEYSVTLITPTGCHITKTQEVLIDAPAKPSICMVSVDSITNKNVVYWETPTESGLDSVFIFRETDVTGNYVKIGRLTVDHQGLFIDNASNPLVQSNQYKMALLDSCGNVSDFSDVHKTMHLSINQGVNGSWNLIWEPYEGFDVSTYRIYRSINDGEMELIGTTAGSSSQYTDFSAPVGYVHYQIEIINPSPCNISGLKSSQPLNNKSRSNIATNQSMVLYINKLYHSWFIYPNPFNSILYIESSKEDHDNIVEFAGIDGRVIKRMKFSTQRIELDVSDIKPGSYILKVQSGNQIFTSVVFKR
jgi:Secretion system C-terminal sorting domain